MIQNAEVKQVKTEAVIADEMWSFVFKNKKDVADGEIVQVKEKLDLRDRLRWELKPESAEDYEEHSLH